ncbi:Stage III sporulation protein AE (spore_III_AE) [Anaerobutyricum hallii]|uniref:Stage III sporulation protein AE (Spore_III_AE) n=1 Tax=Anaerobutyricum hallii TaxID=39488 RepID=A0A285PQQ9_9FIRM|nr:stage III sporulation protein AE [Anaerobutyricum hallii]SOB71953.1 Stage III sporulation protein AE (spore_III_AE) [Anaerobutyricum hallii]
MERRSVYKSFQIVGILFFILFSTSISVLTLQAQTTQKEEGIDITALSRKIDQLDEKDYPDFASIFQKLVSMRFTEAAQEIGQWMTGAVLQEIFSSKIFIGELAGILLFASVFSNISSAFQSYGVSDSGFLISYFLVFSIIFTNFTVMIAMFKDTVILLSSFLKVLLPVYTLAVSLSGNLSTGIVFYEYFMIVVLFLNWIFLNVFLPLLQYYFLLELISHFSQKQNISKLCEGLYFLLAKGIQIIFFLLFGFHLLETMIAPSFDSAKNSILNKMIGLIPGAGSIVQSVAGTAIGSSLVIKNAVGAAGILFLLIFLLLPLIKLVIYIFLYFLLSVVLEPIADERFILCINAAVKCGTLMIKVLCMSSVLFIVVIALTSLTTNYTG